MSETIHATCGHCDTVNRIPRSKLDRFPRCGKCKQPVFSGTPLELNRANLEQILQNNDLPVLVDCWAPWCGPCRSFAPQFEKAAAAWEPRLRFAKLNTDDEPDIGTRWGIRSIPTLTLFRNGREIQRTSGVLPLSQLQQWLQQAGVEQLFTRNNILSPGHKDAENKSQAGINLHLAPSRDLILVGENPGDIIFDYLHRRQNRLNTRDPFKGRNDDPEVSGDRILS